MSGDVTLKQYFNVEDTDFSDVSIDKLNLSIWALSSLKQRKIFTVEQLLNCTEDYLFSLRDLKSKRTKEIILKLKEYLQQENNIQIKKQNTALSNYLENISIGILNLSVRSANGLNAADVKTMNQLLAFSGEDLFSIKNLGATSVYEIIKKRSDFLNGIKKEFGSGIIEVKHYNDRIDKNLRSHIEELILNPEYLPENLTEKQIALIEQIKIARVDLGEEISLEAYSNPEKYIEVRNAFYEFSYDYSLFLKRRESIKTALNGINPEILNKRLYLFVRAYCLQKEIDISSYDISPKNRETAARFISLFDEKYEGAEDKENFTESAKRFAEWLNFDIRKGAEQFAQKIDFYETGLKSGDIRALKLRVSGLTLEEVGEVFGVTRERIRQREKKMLDRVINVYRCSPHDLILFIYALEDGNSLVTLETVKKYLGELADILFYMLKNRKMKLSPAYEYNPELDAVVIGSCSADEDILHKLNEFSKSLPRFVNSGVFDLKINNFCRENGINPQFAKEYLSRKRVKYGCMMCDSKPTKNEMFEYVLRMHFAEGYKIADEDYKNELVSHILRIFGEDYSGDSAHTVDSVVQRVAVLSGRGFYIVRDYAEKEARVIKAVNRYIENSDRTLFNYNELYHKVKKRGFFEGTDITNSYVLHGILNQYGTPYITARDYISKEANYTFLDELDHFAAKKRFFSKQDMMNYFEGTSEAQIMQAIDRSDKIFGTESCSYVYAPGVFNITQEDRKLIYDYLESAILSAPLNINTAFEELREIYPEFFNRNHISQKGMLWAALQYMFKNKFKFARPFISRSDEKRASYKDVLLLNLDGADKISTDRVKELCEVLKINYQSFSKFLDGLTPEYYRANADYIVSAEYAGINNEIIDSTASVIEDMLARRDYIVLSGMCDFSDFPELNIPYSDYLLESILEETDCFKILYRSSRESGSSGAIVVSDAYFDCLTFEEFIVKLTAELINKRGFQTKKQIYGWLRSEGLAGKNMPLWLSGNEYFYYGENGELKSRNG